jgi:hypothetical protein
MKEVIDSDCTVIIYKILGFHSGEDEYCGLLDYDTMYSGRLV